MEPVTSEQLDAALNQWKEEQVIAVATCRLIGHDYAPLHGVQTFTFSLSRTCTRCHERDKHAELAQMNQWVRNNQAMLLAKQGLMSAPQLMQVLGINNLTPEDTADAVPVLPVSL